MGHRSPSELSYAQRCNRPLGLPHSRPRGAKAQGLRYERALARALSWAKHGQWFEYRDRLGLWHCQVDLLALLPSGEALVIEAKYTWTLAGHAQIDQLYAPVVGLALGRPVVGLVVCRTLLPETARMASVTGDLAEGIKLALAGRRVAVQWLGRSALGPLLGQLPGRATTSPVGAAALGL